MSDINDGPVERHAIDRLKDRYIAGDLSLSKLESKTEAVFDGEFDRFDVDGTCLVCGGSTTGGTRYPTMRDVSCPGCGRPRSTDQVPRAVQ